MVDSSARDAAARGRIDFGPALDRVLPPLQAADLAVTIEAVQGPILLVDYLVTRCVEAVVHGCDLVDPVAPDGVAEAVAADALLSVLVARARSWRRMPGRCRFPDGSTWPPDGARARVLSPR